MATNLETKVGRIRNNVTAALAKIAEKGVTVPEGAGSDDLEGLIDAITGGGGSASIPVCSVTFSYDDSMMAVNRGIFTQFIDNKVQVGPFDGNKNGETVQNVVCGSLAYVYGAGVGEFYVRATNDIEIVPNYYVDNFGSIFMLKMPSTPGNYTIECYVE